MRSKGAAMDGGSAAEALRALKVLKYALAILLGCFLFPINTMAFSDEDARQIFIMLDTNKGGQITQVEYENNKIAVIYRKKQVMRDTTITFEETQLNRAWFDAADSNHDGMLSGVEARDALRFESIDTDNKGYFTLEDLCRFLQKIGR